MNTQELPFDAYPHGGRELLGKMSTNNCRHGYGLKLQRITGTFSCGYCGVSLISRYENWLLMQVDHVVPTTMGKRLGIPTEWLNDYCNCLLACSACNTFENQFDDKSVTDAPQSLIDFFDLRDKIFLMRKPPILECQRVERQFFESRPWEEPSSQ